MFLMRNLLPRVCHRPKRASQIIVLMRNLLPRVCHRPKRTSQIIVLMRNLLPRVCHLSNSHCVQKPIRASLPG